MNLKEYYADASEEEQERLDKVYMDFFIKDIPRDEFDEFDKDTFFGALVIVDYQFKRLLGIIKGVGIKMLIMCLISGTLGFLIKGWWFV